MSDYENVSLLATYLLDKLGYNSDIIQLRRAQYAMADQLAVLKFEKINWTDFGIVMAGSRKEGLSSALESDINQLFFDRSAICCQELTDACSHPKDKTVFKMSQVFCSPGYTFLQLLKTGTKVNDVIKKSLKDVGSLKYLSSSFAVKHFQNIWGKMSKSIMTTIKSEIQGPSAPADFCGIAIDYVYTLQCCCPSQLRDWYFRPRVHEWPSEELRTEVLQLGANLVATGCKNDVSRDLEWRFCFNRGEVKLVHSWNETQAKLFIVLKMILKDFLKPENKEITTYTMKNIVFWMSEMFPLEKFRVNNLIHLVRKALKMLKKSLILNFLPYYMIPKRNLFERKIEKVYKKALLEKISTLLDLGPRVLIVCRKIQFAVNLEQLQRLGSWAAKRQKCEEMVLEIVTFILLCDLLRSIQSELFPVSQTQLRRRALSLVQFLCPYYFVFYFAGYDVFHICLQQLTGILS